VYAYPQDAITEAKVVEKEEDDNDLVTALLVSLACMPSSMSESEIAEAIAKKRPGESPRDTN